MTPHTPLGLIGGRFDASLEARMRRRVLNRAAHYRPLLRALARGRA